MVLQPNFARRTESENTPPTNPKLLTSRLHTSVHDASRRRRARMSGSGITKKQKYSIEQAKRRNETRSKASVRFTVTTVPTLADVEMTEAETPQRQPRTYPLSLPKELARPEYKEVPVESILAIDASLADTDMEHIRDSLEMLGPE